MAKYRFLERYRAGEHILVWQELIKMGARVLEEPLRSEAFAVCEEIMGRARHNLRLLHDRLLNLDYKFAEPDAALVDAAPGVISEIDDIEQELGVLPLIAHVWYRTFASVNFCQAEEQRVYRQGVQPPTGPDIFGLGSHPVLIFQSLRCCREQLRQMDAQREELTRQMKDSGQEALLDSTESSPFLPLGGWASNCEPKGFSLPCSGVDSVIYDDGGGDRYFVDELRSIFRWGGFPFWQWALKKPDFYSPFEYRPNFEKLFPLLKEGFLEL